MNFSFVLFFYNMQNAFSAQTIYDDYFFALYDVTCTSIAILFFLIFEQGIDFNYTKREKELGFKLSEFYYHCKVNILERTHWHFIAWFFFSFLSSAAAYFIP